MTSFRIERFDFNAAALREWATQDDRYRNWPVVYALDRPGKSNGSGEIYVGESLSARGRLEQHLKTPKKRLASARVIVDERFNKSACLDLESQLIRLLAGDGRYQVLNRNDGISDAEYFDREQYQPVFDAIFAELLREGIFTQAREAIENSDLFKLSPFKALTEDQSGAVETVVEGLFYDLATDAPSTTVIQGDPGTGKTVVAVYLMKLLSDIQHTDPNELVDSDTKFADFFTPGHPELLQGFRIGLVVPQQSLRKSVQRVFKRTPGLSADMVLTQFDVGLAEDDFDLLIVDEAHRLNRRANQPSAFQNKRFAEINVRLFGADDPAKTQLDWIAKRSRHQIFLTDPEQAVRPADVPRAALDALVRKARADERFCRLWSQLRVRGGADYVAYVKALLSGGPVPAVSLPDYDLRFFTDLGEMRRAILAKDDEVGLSRLLAGYAWPWRSKTDKLAYDIELDDVRLQWNRTATDWVNSPRSRDEVGSIHTIQGYDLNYAGVIIGPDLRYDTAEQRIVFDRDHYFDKKGLENNKQLGITFSDDDILQYVRNIYSVLLTRGILGTYVYVCDPALREYFSRYLAPRAQNL